LLKRQTLTSQVIDHILALIKSGNMKPGERLPTEKQLTASLGVSRTCVREAIKSLESLRLISVRPRVGAILLEPSTAALFSAEHLSAATQLQNTDVLIEFRKLIETGLASLAAERATEQDLAAMRQAIEDHKRALATDKIAYHADIAFHTAIAEASKNPIAILVLKMISQPLEEQRRRTNEVATAAEAGLRDHQRIYRAIEELNPEKARFAMLAHMKTVERYWRIASSIVPEPKDQEETTLLLSDSK
jgi:GntR family transcriptional repressor for pyruvate dehydrogenase complex